MTRYNAASDLCASLIFGRFRIVKSNTIIKRISFLESRSKIIARTSNSIMRNVPKIKNIKILIRLWDDLILLLCIVFTMHCKPVRNTYVVYTSIKFANRIGRYVTWKFEIVYILPQGTIFHIGFTFRNMGIAAAYKNFTWTSISLNMGLHLFKYGMQTAPESCPISNEEKIYRCS